MAERKGPNDIADTVREVGREVDRLADAAAKDIEHQAPVGGAAAAFAGAGSGLLIIGACVGVTAIALRSANPARTTGLIATLCVVAGGALAMIAASMVPREMLPRTRDRLARDFEMASDKVH